MVKRVDCSVVILSYNTVALLEKNLKALRRAIENTKFQIETIVVDNGSSDGSRDMVQKKFPEVVLIELSRNLGYSKGNNKGLKKSSGRYILLLNSDVIISTDTLEMMVGFMDNHPKVGVATCKLIFPTGEIDKACHRGFPTPWAALTYFSGLEKIFPYNPWFSSYHLSHLPFNTTHEIDSPSGAFYLIRRPIIDKVGLLDEDYFMYGEDLDLSYRIKKAGWKIMYVPRTQAIHYKKQSGRASMDPKSRRKATVAFYDTMKIFYRKHYIKKYPRPLMWFIFLVIDIVKSFSTWKV